MNAARLGFLGLCLCALILAACGDGEKTVTETTPASTSQTGTQATQSTATESTAEGSGGSIAGEAGGGNTPPPGNHGPHYFQTPSENIGCYVSAHDARCDIRERRWSPPPEPRSCIKIGLDYGQGIVVGPHRAEFVCAGDTALGGPATLGYGQSAQRGNLLCESEKSGVTCRNNANGHGFFLSRERYRIF